MRRYLFDSNSASDCIFRRRGVHERVVEVRRQGHKVGIGIPILGELLGGIEFSTTQEQNLEILYRNLNLFKLWPFTQEAAEVYGRVYAELRRMGRTIQQIDLQTAAIALNLGKCTDVTCDSDFAMVPGLAVENWAS